MATYIVQVFKLFERIWHWSQAASILLLLFTGFAIHGVHRLISFETAAWLHTLVAFALLLLWIFATFWLFTTGQWRHYIPTGKNFIQVAKYYSFGIFKGDHHPYRKTFRRKHNPLQALTYLLLKIVIFPAIWISGIAYMVISFGYGEGLSDMLGSATVPLIHTIAAIAIAIFIIAHLYLLTTGHSFIAHLKPMITGWDEVDLTDEEAAFLIADERNHIKPRDDMVVHCESEPKKS